MKTISGLVALLLFAGPAHGADYCDSKVGDIVYIIDVTTKFNESEKDRLIAGTIIVLSTVADGQKLSIFTIEDSFSKSRKLFSACKPYCNEKWLGECTAQAARRDFRRWQASVATNVRSVIEPASASLKGSDILLTLSSRFRASARPPERVFIFSDMIENSNLARPRDPNYLKQLRHAARVLISNRNFPVLAGARISVFGFGVGDEDSRRDLQPLPMLELRRLWIELFREFGASDIDIGPFIE